MFFLSCLSLSLFRLFDAGVFSSRTQHATVPSTSPTTQTRTKHRDAFILAVVRFSGRCARGRRAFIYFFEPLRTYAPSTQLGLRGVDGRVYSQVTSVCGVRVLGAKGKDGKNCTQCTGRRALLGAAVRKNCHDDNAMMAR